MAKKQQEQLKIVIGGLLPRDKEMATRSIINKVNKVLRQKICNFKIFISWKKISVGQIMIIH